ncbi:putative F-box protein At5g47300 [Silene latifolia]|uniref:putative F-box protein At5g47300 n=1 Tax=Silene latifolia TaxID=37657 RepID=UPI003D78286A
MMNTEDDEEQSLYEVIKIVNEEDEEFIMHGNEIRVINDGAPRFTNTPESNQCFHRQRCVCKSWCSIIDNPDFIHLHLQLSQINYGNNQLLLIVEGLSNYHHKEWWFTLLHSETLQSTVRIFLESGLYSYLILGSCNGLLLLLQYDKYHSNEEFILWNPCICKSLLLPTCPLPNSILVSTYLLGYASDSKDYKVVVFSSFENTRRNLQFAVYTLRDQLWTVRNMDITTSMFEYFSLLIAVFFRGGAYWLANNDKQGSGLLTHLGSFDFDKERFAFLKLPISLDKTSSFKFLFLLGKSLAVFIISKIFHLTGLGARSSNIIRLIKLDDWANVLL